MLTLFVTVTTAHEFWLACGFAQSKHPTSWSRYINKLLIGGYSGSNLGSATNLQVLFLVSAWRGGFSALQLHNQVFGWFVCSEILCILSWLYYTNNCTNWNMSKLLFNENTGMTEEHKANLGKLCRICGENISKGKSARNCSESVVQLGQTFGIDTSSDDPNVHPVCYCHRCRNILYFSKQAAKKKLSTTQVYKFTSGRNIPSQNRALCVLQRGQGDQKKLLKQADHLKFPKHLLLGILKPWYQQDTRNTKQQTKYQTSCNVRCVYPASVTR